MGKEQETPQQKVIDYFSTRESRWGYTLLLKGTKHFGYYPEGSKNLTMVQAQRLMEDKLAEKINLPSDSLVLDAGCGEGNTAIYLSKKYGWQIKGVDLLNFAIKKATTKAEKYNLKNRVEFKVEDYTYLNFPNETFDGVYTMETLVHAPDYKKALQEFYRVLKPKGKIVLFEYSISPLNTLTSKQQELAEMVIKQTGSHSLPFFLHEEFPKILESVGFKNIVVENITPRVMPMLKKFYEFAVVPYILFVKSLGLQKKFINTTAAAEGYKNLKDRDYGRYNITLAEKT